ncbi:hypothetical protein DRO61_10290 [Candidatus Bathyarchaeota archaeon]|nr:MAG: hypothetical protein DRO61_10290 [Candidatus Bathyarchaeota archaeon]
MIDSGNVIEIIAILFTLLLAFTQWLSSVRRKAYEGERQKELTDLREEIRKEFDKELDEIKLELAVFRDVKSKVDLIEARVGDIFNIMSKMSDNLDKYVEKIEVNIEKKSEKHDRSINDLYATKADKK